jgi:hypothetical protein
MRLWRGRTTSAPLSKSFVSAAEAASWSLCQDRRPETITLVSRAVVVGIPSLSTFANLSADLFHGLSRKRWSLFERLRDAKRPLLHDSNLARHGFDLDPSLPHGNPKAHAREDSGFLPDRLRQDQASGGIDGRLNGILHGRDNTMEGSGGAEFRVRF